MVATDPRREQNFRWFNTGLTNVPITAGEYPVECLYREVLSKDQILEALSFFLVYVPKRDAEEGRQEEEAFTIFPRYHQSRMVRTLADDAAGYFVKTGEIGRKYLINHSAGSGKTLSICWLADRLHSLYHEETNEKLVNLVVILTDRTALDKSVRDDIEKFEHLKDVVCLTDNSAELANFLKQKAHIIVTTIQKFKYILDEIEAAPTLKQLRIAFLIDEAQRSQEGKWQSRSGCLSAILRPRMSIVQMGTKKIATTRKRSPELSKSMIAISFSWLSLRRPPPPPFWDYRRA